MPWHCWHPPLFLWNLCSASTDILQHNSMWSWFKLRALCWHRNNLIIGLRGDISVFTCLCPFVPSKINLFRSTVMQWHMYGRALRDTRRNSPHVAFMKDETYESYSLWKGHCFAQLPSAGAVRGVESHVDRSEMTLKQRQEGGRLLVCPLYEAGAETAQSCERLAACAASWLNKWRALKKRGKPERNRRNDCE